MANKYQYDAVATLTKSGISQNDAVALRRISMTLTRWFELECGDSNEQGSWAIERDDNGDGLPYMVTHYYGHGKRPDSKVKTRIADREKGALKRLAAIMARYPGFKSYVQGDPRGCALYIMRPGDLSDGLELDSYYTRGIAVCA